MLYLVLAIYLYAGYSIAELCAPGFTGTKTAKAVSYLLLFLTWVFLLPVIRYAHRKKKGSQ